MGLGKAGVSPMAELVCFLRKGGGEGDSGPSGDGPGEIVGAVAERGPAGRWRGRRDPIVVVPYEGRKSAAICSVIAGFLLVFQLLKSSQSMFFRRRSEKHPTNAPR